MRGLTESTFGTKEIASARARRIDTATCLALNAALPARYPIACGPSSVDTNVGLLLFCFVTCGFFCVCVFFGQGEVLCCLLFLGGGGGGGVLWSWRQLENYKHLACCFEK